MTSAAEYQARRPVDPAVLRMTILEMRLREVTADMPIGQRVANQKWNCRIVEEIRNLRKGYQSGEYGHVYSKLGV